MSDKQTKIIKSLLVGEEYQQGVELTMLYRQEEDKLKRFWRVQFLSRSVNRNSNPRSLDDIWEKEDDHFDTDSSEQAVSYAVLDKRENLKYQEYIGPLTHNTWFRYTIKVYERSKEGRDSKLTYIQYVMIKDGKEKLDFEQTLGFYHYALCQIPLTYYRMYEGDIPYHWCLNNNWNPSASDYPMFEYKGKYYKTTYYFNDQKAACGKQVWPKPSKTALQEETDLKIEVFDAHFFDKDVIHLTDDGLIIYNDTIRKTPKEVKSEYWAVENLKDYFNENFPEAEMVYTEDGVTRIKR
jgi:hypothetical protein